MIMRLFYFVIAKRKFFRLSVFYWIKLFQCFVNRILYAGSDIQ
jgi:hypothetical protein